MKLSSLTEHTHTHTYIHTQIDARSYLESEYSRLKSAVKAEKRRVRNSKKLGIAFITFNREQDAKE